MVKPICSFLLILLIVLPVGAQEVPEEALQAAEEGLPIFTSYMPSCGTYSVLGWPFQFYYIYDSEIDNYSEGDTIYDVLTEPGPIWYFPLMIGDDCNCLLSVEEKDGEWEASGIGYARLAESINTVRQLWPISEGYDPIFSKHYWGPCFFSIPQVDLYNLTLLVHDVTGNELTQRYLDLRPLGETIAALASDSSYDVYDDDDSDDDDDNDDSDDDGFFSCYIRALKY